MVGIEFGVGAGSIVLAAAARLSRSSLAAGQLRARRICDSTISSRIRRILGIPLKFATIKRGNGGLIGRRMRWRPTFSRPDRPGIGSRDGRSIQCELGASAERRVTSAGIAINEFTSRDTRVAHAGWGRGGGRRSWPGTAFSRDCTCTRTECGTYILPVHRICAHVNM